jgi:hypothetical protein
MQTTVPNPAATIPQARVAASLRTVAFSLLVDRALAA